MALNKFMHPRNPYKEKKPDFKALAIKYPEFRKYATQDVKGVVHIGVYINSSVLKRAGCTQRTCRQAHLKQRCAGSVGTLMPEIFRRRDQLFGEAAHARKKNDGHRLCLIPLWTRKGKF